ncbi:MAG: hypothetical protein PHQ59_04570 [Candidatus Daviesbacteria bacterium]|nr:hypothetical protein [Candidatus Daviesbacteria bacterium]
MAERIQKLTLASAKALVFQSEFLAQSTLGESRDPRVPLAYKAIEQEESRVARIFENAKYNAQEKRRRRFETGNVYIPKERTSRETYKSPYSRPFRWY